MMDVFGNVTSNPTTAWVPEPTVRGTWGILSSCIITISLCVWTAVHLNIPEHQRTKRQIWRKLKWLLLGLLAPEMVAYVAWHQRKEAKKILIHIRDHSGQRPSQSRFHRFVTACFRSFGFRCCTKAGMSDSPPSEKFRYEKSAWTLVHGFYAVMGGFALDSSTSEEPFLPQNRTRVALTPDGLRFLLEHEPDILPDISQEQIQDKSKADGIKKTLVCAQALWFCIQCMSRLAQSLPVSLLELNTFGHSLCTLLIYLLWWSKPLNVDEPTLIQGDNIMPIFAYMWMTSRISGDECNAYDIRGGAKDEFDGIWPFRDPKLSDMSFANPTTTALTYRDGLPDRAPHECSQVRSAKSTDANHPSSDLEYDRDFRRLSNSKFRYRIMQWLRSQNYLSSAGFRFPAGATVRNTAIDHFSPVDVFRWKLALQAIEKYDLEHDLRSRHKLHPYGKEERDLNPRVKPRIDNIIYTLARNELWFGLAAAGSLYGGLHLVAWNAPFSSRLEEILWRLAASSVTMTGLLFGPFIFWSQYPAANRGLAGLTNTRVEGQRIRRCKDNRIKIWGEIVLAGIVFLLMFTVMPLLWLTYVFSRVYLVVECFKNVANLPVGAYQVPQWSSYVPHIT